MARLYDPIGGHIDIDGRDVRRYTLESLRRQVAFVLQEAVLFRATVAQELFSWASINGFGFDLELLYLAQQRGYRIAEVPVNWSDQPGSKVRVLRDGVAMLRDLAVVRRNHQRGRYSLPSFSSELMQADRFRMPAS